MQENNRIVRMLSVVVLLGVISSIIAFAVFQPTAQAQGTVAGSSRTITVNGVGSASGAPDLANIQLGVDVVDTNPGTAYENANTQIETIRGALNELDIANGDIQTSSFNLYWSEQFNRETGMPTGEREYHAQHSLNVTVREIDRAGEVINTAVNAGANSIYGLTFGIANDDAMTNEARLAALDDARARAEQIAGALDVELGEVVNIAEGVSFVPVMQNGIGGLGGGADSAPIAEGMLSVEVQVTVTYLIAE